MKKIFIVILITLALTGCTLPTEQVTENVVKNIEVNLTLDSFEDLLIEVYDQTNQGIIGVSSAQDNLSIGTGTGVIYKRDTEGYYYVITNNHVIEDGNKIYAYLGDVDEYILGELIGSDYKTDLAVFKFYYSETLPIIPFGDYDNVRTGQFAIAIGNPLGYDLYGSMTLGIVSSAYRVMDVDTDSDGVYDWNSVYIQTDAALSPGNSGGALLDISGNLIGINTLKYTDYNATGLGFAIPINIVERVVSDLEEYGEYRRPLLGITAIDVDQILNDPTYNIPTFLETGIYIVSVTPESDADQAGLEVDDIIVSFNGYNVENMDELRKAINMSDVGDTVIIEYYRNGNLSETEILLDTYR